MWAIRSGHLLPGIWRCAGRTPGDLPPWPIVYQQTQRWIRAGFESMVEDLRSLLRESPDARASRRRCSWTAARFSPRRNRGRGPGTMVPCDAKGRRYMRPQSLVADAEQGGGLPRWAVANGGSIRPGRWRGAKQNGAGRRDISLDIEQIFYGDGDSRNLRQGHPGGPASVDGLSGQTGLLRIDAGEDKMALPHRVGCTL